MTDVRTRLVSLRQNLSTLEQLSRLGPYNANGTGREAQLGAKLDAALQGGLFAAAAPARLARIQHQKAELDAAAGDAHQLRAGFAAAAHKCDELAGMLHADQPGEGPPAPAPAPWLQAVADARRARSRKAQLEAAALREIARLRDPVLRLLVDAWTNLIRQYLYESTLRGVARRTLAGERYNARNFYLRQFAAAYVQNQVETGRLQPWDLPETLFRDTMDWIVNQIEADPDVPISQEELTKLVNDLAVKKVVPDLMDLS